MSNDLAAIQARFAEGLLAGGDNPTALFRGDAALLERRFALYRGNLTANWENALRNAYPVIRQMVGDEFFRALAREYGRAIPLQEGDLNRFGQHLPDFLDTFAPVADFPYLPDMARLEWALHRAHQAADTPALTAQTLAAMDMDAIDALRLALHPATTTLHSHWAVADLWQAHQPDGPPWPTELRRECWMVACRPDWRAQLRTLTPGEHAALCAIAAGETFGAALDAAAATEPDFDPAHALPHWLQAGLLILAEHQ